MPWGNYIFHTTYANRKSSNHGQDFNLTLLVIYVTMH
jgi:hypothetical protein